MAVHGGAATATSRTRRVGHATGVIDHQRCARRRRRARYRGRFAPSPTGPLHFGSLVAALASYCDARAAAANGCVRIEDVDEPRSRAGAESAILDALARYGFAWDGAGRAAIASARRITRRRSRACATRGLVYPCACTRRDARERAARRRRRARLSGHVPRRRSAARAARSARACACASTRRRSTFVDRLQGPQRQDLARDVGDFVVRRADGLFAYQLAVVVDDARRA